MRKVDRYFPGIKSQDGAGVKLLRCFARRDLPDFDPFLMMDFFDSTDPDDYTKGFPWHPHRGIETITYLIEGEIEHEDTLGNKGTIHGGDCQWMSAGSGILHQEMPKESPMMLGTQIWLNLPKDEKMSQPKYRDIREEDIKIYEEDGLKVRLIAGSYKGVEGPIKIDRTQPVFFDLELKAGNSFSYDIDDGLNSFAFLVRGRAKFSADEEAIDQLTGVLYKREDKKIQIEALEDSRIFLFAGKPLDEEIAWGGPIVMNTEKELQTAFAELEAGSFIK